MPEDFSFQLCPDDLDRHRMVHRHRRHGARAAVWPPPGSASVINGPIPYAPDGLPLIGPMPAVDERLSRLVSSPSASPKAGGAGKVHGRMDRRWRQTEWDMWAVDPRRYTDYTDHAVLRRQRRRGLRPRIRHALPMASLARRPRPQAVAVHARVKALGGQMGDYNGWERANWFAQEGDDTSEEATHTWARSGPWEQRIREECEAVRDGCGVLAITGFTRLKVEGPGAREFCRWADRFLACRTTAGSA